MGKGLLGNKNNIFGAGSGIMSGLSKTLLKRIELEAISSEDEFLEVDELYEK